jgi:acyl-homoserine-lactone acylase
MNRRTVLGLILVPALLFVGGVGGIVASGWRTQQTASPSPLAIVDGARATTAPTTPAAAPISNLTPQLEEELVAHAMIRRDEFGVPHIQADSEEAAALAHGYAVAEDHGEQLARAFLRARGAQASVFGPEFVEQDVRVHTLRIPEIAAERFRELPPFMQAIVNAYAAGYNRYLAKHRAAMPAWATPVTGVDVLAHCRTLLLLDFALDLRPWNGVETRSGASTMWATAPSLSQSGHAMLMANPHLPWNGPNLFHEVHITVPGVIDISGATFIGTPVVTIGFNAALGWSHTVNRFDSDDVYRLTLDASRTSYQYDGRWLPLQTQSFDLEVKTDSGILKHRQTAQWSHYGPIIKVEGGKALAFKSPNLHAVNFLTQYNAMAKAASLQAFIAAVNMQQLPTFNIAYADKSGSIWYLFNGRIPIRPAGYDFGKIVPGDTYRSEWFTVRPLSELPQLLNPTSGYIQNSNDAPWYANLEQTIDRKPFAGYLPDDGVTWRGEESLKILSTQKALTLERLIDHKFDSTLVIADRIKAELIAALGADARWREGVRVLQAWDNTLEPASRGSVLFGWWWHDYSGAVQRPFKTRWSATDPHATPAGLADVRAAVAAFGRTVKAMTNTFGALDVAWGDVHRVKRGTLDLPVGGGESTLRNVTYTRTPDGKGLASGGDTYVLAVEFAETPRAYTVITYSQASDPRSPYFNNQLALYANKQLKRAWFSAQDVDAHTIRRYRPGEPQGQ